MIYIFGTKVAHLKNGISKAEVCPACKTEDQMILGLFNDYFHIFWIPVFPMAKSGVLTCRHCNHTSELSEASLMKKDEFGDFGNKTRPPIWQFAGLILVGLFIFSLWMKSFQNHQMDLDYIASPQKTDRYSYKTDEGYFSLLTVKQVSRDSVFVSPHQYETEKKIGLRQLSKKGEYVDWTYGISREDLKKMFEDDKIFDVKRW
ncbi:MAG: zinc-ribbon domain-containing protein [Bacteroidota bacterium]